MAFAKDFGVGATAPAAPPSGRPSGPYNWYATGDPLGGLAHPVAAGVDNGSSAPSAPGPPGAPPAGSINLPAPDYKTLLLSDPAYLAWKNNYDRTVGDAGTSRQAALRALALEYGGLPSGFQDTYGDLDPATLQQAKDNPYSDIAQLKSQLGTNTENFKRSLASRGALSSGDLGYGLDQLNQQEGQSEYNLGQQFGQNFQQAIQGYLGSVEQAGAGQDDAIGQAIQDIQATNPGAGGTASLVPNWQSSYGKPVYQTPDGTLYALDANGNPVPFQG